jgi:hypothetical protein
VIMKRRSLFIILLSFATSTVMSDVSLLAQEADRPALNRKLQKEMRQMEEFERTDSLLSSRQFVFQTNYQVKDSRATSFVVVDSLYGEVQDGIRNNLNGQITYFEVIRNLKRKNLTVDIKMRGMIQTADVFINVGPSGIGQATVKSEFPGNFIIYGKILAFEDASVQTGGSHQVH